MVCSARRRSNARQPAGAGLDLPSVPASLELALQLEPVAGRRLAASARGEVHVEAAIVDLWHPVSGVVPADLHGDALDLGAVGGLVVEHVARALADLLV